MLYLLFGFIMLFLLERDDPIQKVTSLVCIEMIVVLLAWPAVFVLYLIYLYTMKYKYKSIFKSKTKL